MTVNDKRVINVGTIGHVDHLNAQRIAAALRQLGITATVAAEGLAELGDILSQFEICAPDPIYQLEKYALESMKPVDIKPQPFWTQQGRRKKGGRGKY